MVKLAKKIIRSKKFSPKQLVSKYLEAADSYGNILIGVKK